MGKDPQPADMQHYIRTVEDNGGVHRTPGFPTTPSTLPRWRSAGNAWEKTGQIWYDTIRDRTMAPTANFASFARHTITNAGHRYGANSPEQKAVADAWQQVGVNPS